MLAFSAAVLLDPIGIVVATSIGESSYTDDLIGKLLGNSIM